jgi:hypothetical protein
MENKHDTKMFERKTVLAKNNITIVLLGEQHIISTFRYEYASVFIRRLYNILENATVLIEDKPESDSKVGFGLTSKLLKNMDVIKTDLRDTNPILNSLKNIINENTATKNIKKELDGIINTIQEIIHNKDGNKLISEVAPLSEYNLSNDNKSHINTIFKEDILNYNLNSSGESYNEVLINFLSLYRHMGADRLINYAKELRRYYIVNLFTIIVDWINLYYIQERERENKPCSIIVYGGTIHINRLEKMLVNMGYKVVNDLN